jgi:hypothetical protein
MVFIERHCHHLSGIPRAAVIIMIANFTHHSANSPRRGRSSYDDTRSIGSDSAPTHPHDSEFDSDGGSNCPCSGHTQAHDHSLALHRLYML